MCSTSLSLSLSYHPLTKLKPHHHKFLKHPSLTLRTSKHTNRTTIRASVSSSSNVEVLLKAPGRVVESDKLPSDVRNRAMEAVDYYNGRVTIGDVASKAGLNLDQSQKALQALASDTDGFLEVSDEGDVLYVFPKDYRSKLVGKSLRMKIEPLAEKAKSTAEYLIRVTFGTTLVASIVLVTTAIIVIMASGKSDSDSDSRKRRSYSSRSYNSGVNVYFSPTDLFWYWDRDYYRRSRRQGGSEGMNFIQSIFSFVFGDGDPNEGLEEMRWKLIGQYIASNGGVVTAEELAPYLDVRAKDESDDSYILPVLLRFDGQPLVDEEGTILYIFPSLQRTASSEGTGRKEYVGRWSGWDGRGAKFFEENKWSFSNTSATNRALVVGLGVFNLFGLIVLSNLLKNMTTLPSGYVAFVASLLPFLKVYAGSFFAIPLVRWLFISRTNSEIEKRNQARKKRAQAIEKPDLSLRRKLLSARDMAERNFIGKERIVYSTDKDMDEQGYEAREWESRFKELDRMD